MKFFNITVLCYLLCSLSPHFLLYHDTFLYKVRRHFITSKENLSTREPTNKSQILGFVFKSSSLIMKHG